MVDVAANVPTIMVWVSPALRSSSAQQVKSFSTASSYKLGAVSGDVPEV
jgi:hypothetical protein